MAVRLDTVPIRDPKIDPQTGFLYVRRVPIAQVMVQPYKRPDDSIEMEAKLPENLLSDATVESANNKPVTNNHPSELVTKSNSNRYMKGFTTSNAHVEGNMLYNDIAITDENLIDEIQSGRKTELSIGFETEVIPQSGELNGVKYDAVQKNIQINHVAVVKRGRAGHNVRITGDSAIAIEDDKGESMDTTKIRIGDSDINVAVADADKVTALDKELDKAKAELDSKNAEIKDLKSQLDTEKGKVDAIQNKADSALKENEDLKSKYEGDSFDEKVEKKMQERLDLIEEVRPYLGDDYDFKGKGEKELKVDAIKKQRGQDLSDKSLDYVKGSFSVLEDEAAKPVVAGLSNSNTSVANDEDDALAKIKADRLNMYNRK